MAGAGGVILAFALPGAAYANGSPEQGVHVDPGSPAGKQYAFPINSARNETSGGGSSGSSGSSSAPLFGEGITPSGGAGATAPRTPAAQRRGARHATSAHLSRRHRVAQPAEPSQPASFVDAAAGSTAGSGDNSWLALAGGGALVLLLGGGGGVVLRRHLM